MQLRNRRKVLIVSVFLLAGAALLGTYTRGTFQFDVGTSRGPLGPVGVHVDGNFGKEAQPAQVPEVPAAVTILPVPAQGGSTREQRQMVAEYVKMQQSLRAIEAQTRKELEKAGSPWPEVEINLTAH